MHDRTLYKLKFISKKIFIPFFFFAILLYSCINPFAPKLTENPIGSPILSDQRSIDGIFENFRYSYIFKDTVVYGNLIADDFTFVFRNYDRGVDVSWGRDEDMLTTSGLFQATQNLDLIWNEVYNSIGDSVLQDISRSFNLTIVFGPTDIVRIQGRAIFRIKRDKTDYPWKIIQWRDESNY